MSKEPELKARDKVVVRMTRECAVEENLTAGTEQRVSKRLEEAELVKPAETAAPSEALSPEEQKKVQMRRQQRQFQTEHAEDNDTQPPSETSVTEEKRAENPPQNAPEPLPSETPFKPPVLEQHGVSSHTGTVIAETVVTHKLRKTSAVEAVDADAVLSQAAETVSAKPIIDDAVPPTKRMQKLERKSEKAHERLDAAREKLPTHKVLKKERVFDEETGKGKTRLHFEDELKKPKGKGKLQFEADKTVRKVGDTLASGIHGKIHEVEQENTAVEAAHKTEIAAETAARHFRHHRESSVNKPYEKVSKLEHKADAADAKLQYERNQQEHPEMKNQNMNKHYQKQSIMAMPLVDVGCNHIFVLALEPFVRKLLSNFMSLFRCHFTDVKGLDQMTGKHLRHLHSLLYCEVSCPFKFFCRRIACSTPVGRNIAGIVCLLRVKNIGESFVYSSSDWLDFSNCHISPCLSFSSATSSA